MERVRKVDVDSLSSDQAATIGFEVGKKIDAINAKALAEINAIMKIYGIKAKMVIQFEDIETGEIIS